MKNLKNMLAAITLAVVLMVGTANAGILMSDLNSDNQPSCTQTDKENGGIIIHDATGIIIAGFTGIIIAGFTGIIIAGFNETPTTCGR